MKIDYRAAEKNDFAAVMEIAETELNSGLEYDEYMRGIFDKLGNGAEGVLALDAEKLVGFAFVEEGMALSGDRTDFFDEIKADINGDKIWTGAATAVLPEYMNFKIGAALYIFTLSRLEDIGAKHLLLEIWVRPDGYMPSDPHLRIARDYTEYGVVKNFYHDASLKGYICPVCGKDCKCMAKIAVVHI
ncbi:MAG: hypothetical protein Q4F74_06660 [Synergistaceae bacterium]|nr:hypothetical protein [Synergistaceae bacterium]